MTSAAAVTPGADWLPVGEEPQPLGSITHCTILRHAGISLLSARSGDIDCGNDRSTGMYLRDTRHLSLLRLTFGGVAPILLDASAETTQSAIFTNPAMRSANTGEQIPAQTLIVRRRRTLANSLLESLTISNYGHSAVVFELTLDFDADFHDIFEVRGYERTLPANLVANDVDGRDVRWSYTGADGVTRTTVLSFSEPPTALTARRATFQLHVEPRDTHQLSFEVAADAEPGNEGVEAGMARVHSDQQRWLAATTRMETDDDAVNAMLERSLLDIHALQTRWGDDEFVAAGVPWFDTLFGRDSLITGIEMLPFAPGVLRSALLVLARYQADKTDPAHDETPGKIPHELRWGELAQAGEVPFARYYGSVDATPLYILAAAEYVRWTQDHATLRKLWPSIQRAMAWCRGQTTTGVGGFLTYHRESARGLENQGWKDSHDAIVWPDGALVEPPIALVEVQAYFAAALGGYAHMASVLGEKDAAEAAREAPRFCKRMDDAFGHDELGYTLCIDGSGRPVATPASNAGQVLWAGVARKDLARCVAGRLMEPDLFSGWGVRTLSSSVAGYNPLGYHVGSVWPHDNALFLAGLRWYGFDDEASRLGSALVQMSLNFAGMRVPELFSGDARSLRSVPTPYPVASRPQAWAAASLPYVMSALAGFRPGGPGQLTIVRPMLPAEVNWLRVCNLRFGSGSADITFRRSGPRVSVEVERLDGGIDVVLSDSFADVALDDAPRT